MPGCVTTRWRANSACTTIRPARWERRFFATAGSLCATPHAECNCVQATNCTWGTLKFASRSLRRANSRRRAVIQTSAVESVSYTTPDAGYMEKRGLRRHARVLDLCALGVGAVISGECFGWNFGLISGGFGGRLLALVII